MLKPQRRAAFLAAAGVLIAASLLAAERSTAARSGPDTSCGGPAPCLEWDNTGGGSGVKGSSAHGNGLLGVTTANATVFGHTGVLGTDASTTSFKDSGVIGTSMRGNGVSGISGTSISSITGSGDGVYGNSAGNYGVHGQIESNGTGFIAGVFGEDLTASSIASGVRGTSTFGWGVSGESTNGNGLQGVTESTGASGVYGEADYFKGGGFGVAGRGTVDAVGVFADNVGGTRPALYIHQGTNNCSSACNPEIIANNGVADIMSLDTGGNMILRGTLTQNGTPLAQTQTSDGRNVIAYGSRTTEPAMEDFGEAQLVAGQATVSFDRTFASTIDQRTPYLVFLTADGATSGSLYVASKTATGFVVRENGGGRSSIVFDYRIVARPFGSTASRLPASVPPHFARVALPARTRTH
jgi:hypothetical protein